MRKLVLALAAAAAFGIAAPAVTSTPASAETVIIKKRGHDHGWRRAHNRADKVVIIKKRGRIEDDDRPDQIMARYNRTTLEDVFLDVARGRMAEGTSS